MYTQNNSLPKENDSLNEAGEDSVKKGFQIRELPNLLERNNALKKLVSFLTNLRGKRRGLLRIIGPQGSGRTCFLKEASSIALELNYEVIFINKDNCPLIKCDEVSGTLESGTGKAAHQRLESFIPGRKILNKKNGLILIIDDTGQISNDTLIFFSQLLERENDFAIALIYSGESESVHEVDFINLPINKTIYLEPLSPKGLCIWLKRALAWEPPRRFLEWLYNETFGLPKLVEHGIISLLENGVIVHDEKCGWSINKDYLQISLKNKINAPKNNLPVEAMEFVGRENEIDKISTLFGRARLVSLIGPGGIGKTRLSLKAASILLNNYRDGVFFIPLAAVTHGDLLVSSIARVLNITEIKGQHALNSVKSVLQDKKLLMILDNFEQIIDEAPVLSELLAAAPGLSMLITSREPLNIYGEYLIYVPALELPDPREKVPVEILERQPAVALFLSRARAVQYDFMLTEENAAHIAELCVRMEGIPLAIELAAVNIRQIPIETMLSRSKNCLNWLETGARDLPDRQRTLRNTIEWGYNLLNENQKSIFRRLGAFRGAFDSKAASKVVDGKNDLMSINEGLSALVSKSILIKSRDPKGEQFYFDMLEAIREFAVELLSESNEERYIKCCHADYFLSLAIEAESKMNGTEYRMWLDKLDLAYPDIIEALDYLKSTGSFEKELKLAGAMGCYWDIRGYWSKGQAVLEQIIRKCDSSTACRQYLVKAYQWYGSFTDLKGNYAKAVQIYEEGLRLAHANNDLMGEASIQYRMSLTAKKTGNYKYVEELMQQSLCIYRKTGYKHGIADVLQDIGQLYYFKGEYEQAEKHSKESLEISRELEDKYRVSKALGILGLTARGKGNFNEASDMLHRYLLSCEELNDRNGIADALMSIAEMTRSQGDYELAQGYYLKCLNLGRELGCMSVIARGLKELGEISRCKGDLKKAYELFDQSLAVLKETGESGEEIWIYRNMAELELELGNSLKAEELFLKGIKVYLNIGTDTLIYVFLVIEGLAAVALALEQLDRAACLFGAADRLYKIIGNLLSKSDIDIYRKRLYKLRQKMYDADFQKSWNEGKLMSLEHVLDYAVRPDDYRYDKSMANKMIDYIHKNYNKDISLYDISEYFNMSSNYLSTMFKYYTGRNFKDYLNSYRVKIAKELFKSSNLKINEVSKKVGCSNDVTFIRMFKKYEGMPPSQYIYEQIVKYR